MTGRTVTGRLSIGTLLVVSLWACKGDPVAKARHFTASGDAYADRAQYQAAALEYRNAIAHQPNEARLHHKLAVIYDKTGEHTKASAAFARVVALSDSYPDADLRVAKDMLSLRRFEEADRHIRRVLARDPHHVDALLTSAKAFDGMGRQSAAVKLLDTVLTVAPNYSAAHVTRGLWHLRSGDTVAARGSLTKATELDANSPEAWSVLGMLHWHLGAQRDAESALAKAVEFSRDSTDARRLLAAFYVSTGRPEAGEPYLRALADNSVWDQLALADYYLAVGKREAAASLLGTLLKEKGVENEARLRAAVLAHQDNRHAAADGELDLAMRGSTDPLARMIKSEWLLLRGDLDGALEHAKRAAELLPTVAEANYALGLLRFTRGELEEAEHSLKMARRQADNPAAVDVQLASLAFVRADMTGAVRYAESAATRAPGPLTTALFARALRLSGELTRARGVVHEAAQKWNAAALNTELGFIELAAGRPREARRAFERALRIVPKATESRYGFLAAEVAQGRTASARSSIDAWRVGAQDDVQLSILSARLDFEEGQPLKAQQKLEEVVARLPHDTQATEALAQLYVARGDLAAAAKQYEGVVAAHVRPVGPLTMLGMLRQQLGDAAGARVAYERALAIDGHAGIAANNLAWLLADAGHYDEAIRWARQAERDLRRAPEALDTLGWIYHLAGKQHDAIELLSEACDKAPRNPTYRYHLGAAYLSAARRAEARTELTKALQLSSSFAGADVARRLLQRVP